MMKMVLDIRDGQQSRHVGGSECDCVGLGAVTGSVATEDGAQTEVAKSLPANNCTYTDADVMLPDK